MKFLFVLLAVAAEFTITTITDWRSSRWSTDWSAWVNRNLGRFQWWRGWPAAIVILGLPVSMTFGLFAVLDGTAALLGHGLSLFVLLAMLGPQDLNDELERYKNAVADAAGRDVAHPEFVVAARGIDLGAPSRDAEFDATRVELAALALAADRAWFQPIFWYFALGPAAAVLYRLVANLRFLEGVEPGQTAALAQAREAMEWLPARMTALALGLAGTLVPVLERVREIGMLRWAVSGELVANASLAAADNGRIHDVISGDVRIYRLNSMFALIKRALTVWLAAIAVFALLLA